MKEPSADPAIPASVAPSAQARTCYQAGVAQLAQGNVGAAEQSFRLAVALAPGFAEAHGNLGYVCEQRADLVAAEQHYRRALALDPQLTTLRLNLAAVLHKRKRFGAAETLLREAIAEDRQNPALWSNLGALYASLYRAEEAEYCCRKALATQPGHAGAALNLAYLLLQQGRYAEAWPYFEQREALQKLAPLDAMLGCPRWRGEALAGKRLIIGLEAGHGDLLQFIRYAPLLKASGAAHVLLFCHPALKRLLQRAPGIDRVLAYDDPLGDTTTAALGDYWVSPFSLPALCGTTLDNLPASLPYVPADAELRRQWRARLPAGRKVGLVWRGNPQFENDADRSVPGLATLAPLWRWPDVHFLSLQKGAGEDEAAQPPAGQPLLNLGPELHDFADTAAVVSELDLVISVDSAVAHLAGALGKPCCLLLPAYRPDWRWLLGRSDSPWYPGVMRLYRQQRMGDWVGVLATLASDGPAFTS